MEHIAKLIILFLSFLLVVMQDLSNAQNSKIEKGLIGYWKLVKDCQDHSGNGNHGKNNGVEFTSEGINAETGAVAKFFIASLFCLTMCITPML